MKKFGSLFLSQTYPHCPVPFLAGGKLAIHIAVGISEKRLVPFPLVFSQESLCTFLQIFILELLSLSIHVGLKILPHFLSGLHIIRISRDVFTLKGMGLMILCLLLCRLLS